MMVVQLVIVPEAVSVPKKEETGDSIKQLEGGSICPVDYRQRPASLFSTGVSVVQAGQMFPNLGFHDCVTVWLRHFRHFSYDDRSRYATCTGRRNGQLHFPVL